MVYEPAMGHACSSKISEAFNAAIAEQIKTAHPPTIQAH
jgi:hypothetical protein